MNYQATAFSQMFEKIEMHFELLHLGAHFVESIGIFLICMNMVIMKVKLFASVCGFYEIALNERNYGRVCL